VEARFGPGELELIGVDAGEMAAGFDFDGARGSGGGEILQGGSDAGEGYDGVDAEGSEWGERERVGTGRGEKIAAVDGEGKEVVCLGEVLGEGGARDGTVNFVEVNGGIGRGREDIGRQVRKNDRARGCGQGPGEAVASEDGGGALSGWQVESEEKESLYDGAVVADDFEVGRREGIEIDGGAEFDHDGAGAREEALEEVGAWNEVGVSRAAFAGGAAGGVDVDPGVGGQFGQEVLDVAGLDVEGVWSRPVGGIECVEAEAGGADGRQIDGGDGGDVGEGEGVAADAGTEVEDARGAAKGETGGLVAGDVGVGGLFEGLGGGPDVGKVGEFGDGFGLNSGEGEGGVRGFGGELLAECGNLRNGGIGGVRERGDGLAEAETGFGVVQIFEGGDGDLGVVGLVAGEGRHGGIITGRSVGRRKRANAGT
jgi:hypothetical protein